MPDITLYVPDDLAAQIKDADLPRGRLSQVFRAAVYRELAERDRIAALAVALAARHPDATRTDRLRLAAESLRAVWDGRSDTDLTVAADDVLAATADLVPATIIRILTAAGLDSELHPLETSDLV